MHTPRFSIRTDFNHKHREKRQTRCSQLELMRALCSSVASDLCGHTFLSTIRIPAAIAMGFTLRQCSDLRKISFCLMLLLNTPLSIYADRVNKKKVFLVGTILQFLSIFIFLSVNWIANDIKTKFITIGIAYFLLDLSKSVISDTLKNTGIFLFLKPSTPDLYTSYLLLLQRKMLFAGLVGACLGTLFIQPMQFKSSYFFVLLFFIYSRTVFSVNQVSCISDMQIQAIQRNQKFPQAVKQQNRLKNICFILNPLLTALKILLTSSWGIYALLSTCFLSLIRENVLHQWQMLFFGEDMLQCQPINSWQMSFITIFINIGFTVTSLTFLHFFKKINRNQPKPFSSYSFIFLGGAAICSFFLGISSPVITASITNRFLIIASLAFCFGSQEIALLLFNQLFAQSAKADSTNTIQHLLRCLRIIAVVAFLHFYPGLKEMRIFCVLGILFIALLFIFNFWDNSKNTIRTKILEKNNV